MAEDLKQLLRQRIRIQFAEAVGRAGKLPDLATQNFIEAENQAKLENYKQNTTERKKYAELIWSFTCFWCLFIGLVILGCGLGKLTLSDLVITTLIGSTTITLTGFFVLVTQYLFNKEKST